MSNVDKDGQAHADLLNWIQMEALGIERREKITTSDFVENSGYTSVSKLEGMRRELGGNYKPGEQGKKMIADWQNVHRFIEDDGTASPRDLRSINEGLGQTHRAKLMEDDNVRGYSGEPSHRKDRSQNYGTGTKKNDVIASRKVSSKQAARHRVTRERIVKGSSTFNTPSPADRNSCLALPTIKSIHLVPSKVQDGRVSRSAAVTESVQRQQRAIHQSPVLADPKAFLASIQGVKLKAFQEKQTPHVSGDTAPQISKKPQAIAKPDMSKTQAASTLPSLQDSNQLAQKFGSPKNGPKSSEKSKNSDVGQQLLPSAMPGISGTVSLPYLMSLNINFTQEQLRLLKAHSQADSIIDATSEASEFSNENALSPPHATRPLEAEKTLSSTVVSKAPPVSYANSSSDSIPTSPVLARIIPAAPSCEAPPMLSISAENQEPGFQMKAEASDIEPIAESPPLIAAEPPVTLNHTSQAIKQKSVEILTSTNDLLTCQANLSTTSGTTVPIDFSASWPSVLNNAIHSEKPSHASIPPATAISRSEFLRQQREMIIGSQVYINRYSQVAGSLVDKFKALSLTDSEPKSTSATRAKFDVVNPRSSTSVSQTTATIRPISVAKKVPSAAPLLRPRFIPDEPSPLLFGSASSVLAPASVNSAIYVNRPLGAPLKSRTPRSTPAGEPSLPPHLLGKIANSDTGVAARAQYGS